MLEKSVLPVGQDSSHATLKMTSGLSISYMTSLIRHHEKHQMTFGEARFAKTNVKNKKGITNGK